MALDRKRIAQSVNEAFACQRCDFLPSKADDASPAVQMMEHLVETGHELVQTKTTTEISIWTRGE